MGCFIDLSNDIKKSSQFTEIKEISDLANNILISGKDFDFKMDDLIVMDFLGQGYEFILSKKHRSHFTERIQFFDIKKMKQGQLMFILHMMNVKQQS